MQSLSVGKLETAFTALLKQSPRCSLYLVEKSELRGVTAPVGWVDSVTGLQDKESPRALNPLLLGYKPTHLSVVIEQQTETIGLVWSRSPHTHPHLPCNDTGFQSVT